VVNSYARFRKRVNLAKVPAKAPFFITADQSYRLFVNGMLVARGPARGYQSNWPYDELDLAPFLKVGENLIAVRAHHPGRSTFQYRTEGFAGLLVAARWGKVSITSDATWLSSRQLSASRDTVQCSMQLFNQEHVDLRKEDGDWLAAGYDDSAWEAPAARAWNAAPWFALQPRGIPQLEEKEIASGKLIGESEGACAPGYADVRDVVTLRYAEARGHRLANADGAEIRVKAGRRGRFRSYLIDFGRTVVGNYTLEISGASGGEIIDTHYVETIDERTLTPDLKIPVHCRTLIGDRLVCRAGDASHTFYHHNGFRFAEITVRDAVKAFSIRPRFHWTGYPLERRGAFESSDAVLNGIWETCAWTQQCCALDAYVDTPWREQAQWWGDARVQGWNTFHLSGDPRLLERGIAQIAAQTTPDGVTYGHAPTMAHECILPDFTLIWLLTIWDHYWQTGGTQVFLRYQAAVERALDYFRGHIDPVSGLVTNDPRYWLFLDWADFHKDGAPSVYNLLLLSALERMATLYRQTRQPKAAAELGRWAAKLRIALARLVGKDGLMRDGLDTRGKVVAASGIHTQTLALSAGVKGFDDRAALDKILLPYVRGTGREKIVPSAYWCTYVLKELSDRGHGAEVIAFIKRHWEQMTAHGTTWEGFASIRGQESFSHAWSAHPLYHLMQTAGGVVQTAAGWKEIVYAPVFADDHCKTTVPTPHGPITSVWRRDGDQLHVALKLPRGVSARVKLPGLRDQTCRRNGKWTLLLKTRGSTTR
jgi:hypothetical protein